MKNYLLNVALTDAGFAVVAASNGKEAEDMVRREKFDLILLDLLMPQVDGISFYNSLTNKLKKHIPIIVLTNVSSADSYGPHIKNVLIKANVSLDEVVAEVKKHIG